jgi:hypothetical protein
VKGGGRPSSAGERRPVSVVTRMRIAAPVERIWDGLMFFEDIPRRPPLLLRLLLPAPIRAEGPRSAVGDETRCVYEGGSLLKRATRVDQRRHYAFEVAEQQLAVGAGIRLLGGGYTLRERPDGATGIELETRYLSPRRPAWLWRPIEAAVCHAFHRHILAAVRWNVESRQRMAEEDRPVRPMSVSSQGHTSAVGRAAIRGAGACGVGTLSSAVRGDAWLLSGDGSAAPRSPSDDDGGGSDQAGGAHDEESRGNAPVLGNEADEQGPEGDGPSEHEAVEAHHPTA